MRVLVTGAAGFLGQLVGRRFHAAGIDVTMLDRRAPAVRAGRLVRADVLDASSVRRAAAGHDVIVHAAALHGIHIEPRCERQFLLVNGVGTTNVLEAAVETGSRVVFISSTSVYGVDRHAEVAVYLDEDAPLCPKDINDLCKVLGEQLCAHFRTHYGVDCVSLRAGRFYPTGWLDSNLRKLAGGVDAEDVAEAVYLAATAAKLRLPVYCISAGAKFDDLRLLRVDPRAALERRYPGAVELFDACGIEIPPIDRVVSIAAAHADLGYSPAHTIEAFLAELNAVRRGGAPKFEPTDLLPGRVPVAVSEALR